MKRYAVFVEGHTEAVFVGQLLQTYYKPQDLEISFVKTTKRKSQGNSPHNVRTTDPKVHYLILDVEGDGNVLGELMDREEKLFRTGYKKVFSLQDMYSANYEKIAGKVISEDKIKDIQNSHQTVISSSQNSESIKLHYSVMEIEGWFLGMPNLFVKIDKRLTISYIKGILNVDLTLVDIEKNVFKPSTVIVKLFKTINRPYDKSLNCAYSVSSKLDKDDFEHPFTAKTLLRYRRFNRDLLKGNRKYLL